MLLFAKQSPQEACFLELRREATRWPELPVLGTDGMEVLPANWRFYKFLQPFRVLSDDELPFGEEASISVLEGLRFQADGALAPHDPRPFELFVQFHPRRAQAVARPSGSGGRISVTVQDLLLQECPWLDRGDFNIGEHNPKGSQPRRRGGARATAAHIEHTDAKSDEDDHVPDHEDSEGDVDGGDHGIDVDRELAGVRADLAVAEVDVEAYFAVTIRGGRWTLENRDVVADCAMGKARDSETRFWSEAFEFPKSKSFSFRLYGRERAVMLAREFCRRGNYFAGLYFDAVNDDFTYTADLVAACPDDVEFLEMLLSLDVDEPAFAKGQEIRACAPVIE
jgi:hypothetical protein